MKNGKIDIRQHMSLSAFVTLQTDINGCYLGSPISLNRCRVLEPLDAVSEVGNFSFKFEPGNIHLCGLIAPGSSVVRCFATCNEKEEAFMLPVSKLEFQADGGAIPKPPFSKGDEVYYIPDHAENYLHPDAQAGTVRRVQLNSGGSFSVWVSYDSGDTAALSPIKNLKKREFVI